MRGWAKFISEYADQLAALESADCGKAIRESCRGVVRGTEMLGSFVDRADELLRSQRPPTGRCLTTSCTSRTVWLEPYEVFQEAAPGEARVEIGTKTREGGCG